MKKKLLRILSSLFNLKSQHYHDDIKRQEKKDQSNSNVNADIPINPLMDPEYRQLILDYNDLLDKCDGAALHYLYGYFGSLRRDHEKEITTCGKSNDKHFDLYTYANGRIKYIFYKDLNQMRKIVEQMKIDVNETNIWVAEGRANISPEYIEYLDYVMNGFKKVDNGKKI